MKKVSAVLMAILAAVIFSGCVNMGGKLNTITTYDKNGLVVAVQEMSDDAVYYNSLSSGKTAIDCTGKTFEQCGLLIAIGGLVDVAKGYPARGMNGYELVSKISGDVVSAVPYGAVGFVAYEALKRTTTVNVSGESTYSANETHLTGNDMGDGNSVDVPNQSPPTTTTTTTTVP